MICMYLVVFIVVFDMLGDKLDALKSIFHFRTETLRHRIGEGESIVRKSSEVGSCAIGWKYFDSVIADLPHYLMSILGILMDFEPYDQNFTHI